MQKPSDERLIAYLDGELDARERGRRSPGGSSSDEGLRERAGRLAESAALLRAAFDEVLREPLPERLIAAARGETGAAQKVTSLARPSDEASPRPAALVDRRAGRGRSAIVGRGVGYFAANQAGTDLAEQQAGRQSRRRDLARQHRRLSQALRQRRRQRRRPWPTCRRPKAMRRTRWRRSCRPTSGCRISSPGASPSKAPASSSSRAGRRPSSSTPPTTRRSDR